MKVWALAACLLASSCALPPLPASRAAVVEEVRNLAEQGNPEAIYYLGMFYNNGISVAQDNKRAFELFERSAAAGNALASYKLGCYYDGQFPVVPIDAGKALHYKLIAAQAGYSRAQLDVANSYYGLGRFDEAINWWNSAAKQGEAQSLYNLAVIHKEGRLAAKDLKQSYAYFKLAKLQSERKISPAAQRTLDEFKADMTTEEIEQAERIVAGWTPQPTPLTRKTLAGFAEVIRFAASGGR